MRKFAFLIFLLSLTIAVGFYWLNKPKIPGVNYRENFISTPTPAFLPADTFAYRFNSFPYRVSWFIANPKTLTLIPNYSQKRTGTEVNGANSCNHLVNAGFYNQDGTPIGLIVNNGQIINGFQTNLLFNGIFSVSDKIPEISAKTPQSPRLAVQSGPILISGGQPQILDIKDDESARRIVVAITKDERLFFLSFYNPESVYEGPLLTDLPAHLQKFEELSRVDISDALNLDGGSASVFITKEVSLGELTNVGSFFCAR